MLRESKGNMYDFVTQTWNPIKGKCPHGCSYCYMKRWGEQNSLRLDKKEMQTNLGSGNFIFVGSSTDMFADEIPQDWIRSVLEVCRDFPNNRYLFQTKNPANPIFKLLHLMLPAGSAVACTTIETNRWLPQIMGNSPTPYERAWAMRNWCINKYVTIEPIIDFDLEEMVELIRWCNPVQVNIGSDSGHNNLPEPSRTKLLALIEELKKFTTIHRKSNLGRMLEVSP